MADVIRQGDVVLVRCARPRGQVRRSSQVLAHGEATGHSHDLVGGHVVEIAGDRYAASTGRSVLTHQEHAHLRIPRGIWRVLIQREWTPTTIRRVRD